MHARTHAHTHKETRPPPQKPKISNNIPEIQTNNSLSSRRGPCLERKLELTVRLHCRPNFAKISKLTKENREKRAERTGMK